MLVFVKTLNSEQALLCSVELGSIKCNFGPAKIGIIIALKSDVWFVSETIGV